MLRPLHLLLLPCMAAALCGCMFFETPADRHTRSLPNFRAGYADGCATANAQGADMRHGDVVRDEALYETDKVYRAGWANGHGACQRQAPQNQTGGPLQDANPGGGHY